MPFINIKVAREEATIEQKREIIRRVTDIMVEVLGKDPQRTMVIFEEIDPENVGMGGRTIADIRAEKLSQGER